ncbi:methyltransferase domain-containing protein [Candidatus Endowatersipora endosymbiont of Watersipora subatra]|uniref:methyltransferase domain-containing protein n=1 Tax=Candidatus Endowatersipora endosymbiont of Watersipora subatra TaxID=3077946 RepID=UPI00312C7A95
MFDRSRHLARLARAKNIFDNGHDFLIRETVKDMIERLSLVQRPFEGAIALFGRSSFLFEAMKECHQISTVIRIEDIFSIENLAVRTEKSIKTSSPDRIILPENSADLIISPLTLHWASDLPGALIQLQRILRPDGLLLATLPGPGTLSELRESLLIAESEIYGRAVNRMDRFTDIRDAGALLQRAGFALPVADQYWVTVRYNQVMDLIRDLRRFAATFHLKNISNPCLTQEIMEKLMLVYRDRFSDLDGRIRASFSIISLSGWGPHESQQKPLKPGSAQFRLSDILKTKEHKI